MLRQNIVVFARQVTLEAGDAADGAAIWPTQPGTTLTFDQFYTQLRTGVKDEMTPFSAEEIPDSYLLHLWTC